MAGMVTLVVWLAQQADGGRRVAVAAAARATAAEAAARDGEIRLFQFLDAMPVAVFVATPDGRPFYANDEAGACWAGASYRTSVPASWPRPTMPSSSVRTGFTRPRACRSSVPSHGQSSHLLDMEIRKPDGDVIPIEIWGRPVSRGGRGGRLRPRVFADVSDRHARERRSRTRPLCSIWRTMRSWCGIATVASCSGTRAPSESTALPGTRRWGGSRTRFSARGFPSPSPTSKPRTAADGRWKGELVHRCADGRIIMVESRWVAQCGPDGSLVKIPGD